MFVNCVFSWYVVCIVSGRSTRAHIHVGVSSAAFNQASLKAEIRSFTLITKWIPIIKSTLGSYMSTQFGSEVFESGQISVGCKTRRFSFYIDTKTSFLTEKCLRSVSWTKNSLDKFLKKIVIFWLFKNIFW